MDIFDQFIKYIKTYLYRRKELRKLRRAKEMALYKAETRNRRYFVLRDWDGNPIPLNRDEIKLFKKKGLLNKGVNFSNLAQEALFIADPPKSIL